jgi:DNA-binding CsgD family transcriptional regulator
MKPQSAISHELQIFRYKRGVKLVRPNDDAKISLGSLLKQSFNVFIQDVDQGILEANDPCWSSCGFQSIQDAIGANASKVCADKCLIERFAQTNHQIISQQTNVVVNENLIFSDGSEIRTLSLKFPWYDDNDRIIGTFGCALNVTNINLDSVANDLNFLNQNLYDHHNVNSEQYANIINKYQFTRRETQIIASVIRGRTLPATAKLMNISSRTAENYFATIKDKLGVTSKTEVIEMLYKYYS